MRTVIKNKCRLCRASGQKLYLRGDRCYLEKCAMIRRNYRPGVHGATKSRGGHKTDYGFQLLEKQKLKNVYGLNEVQLARYVTKAKNAKGLATENLVQLLESRLDNVVFRLGLASSRQNARQLVSHGHIQVNGRRVNIASFQVSKDDVILSKIPLLEGSTIDQVVKKNLKDRVLPKWFSFDAKAGEAKVLEKPQVTEMSNDLNITATFEYYSRR